MTLDELQAICDKATPGIWTRSKYDSIVVDGNWVIDAKTEEDFEFVMAAREYMPRLLHMVRAPWYRRKYWAPLCCSREGRTR